MQIHRWALQNLKAHDFFFNLNDHSMLKQAFAE
jgi:hypothetical protein